MLETMGVSEKNIWRVMVPTALVVLGVALPGSAGPWSALPDAVSTLRDEPDNQAAENTVRAAEESLLAEAAAGHVAAAAALMDAYETLVTPLADGDLRCDAVRSRVTTALVAYGDRVQADDLHAAGVAWSLAASIEASPGVLVRLNELLLPPSEPEPGDIWRSAMDAAELVFVPGGQFELGCTRSDTNCRDDEDGTTVTVEDFWVERTEVSNDRYRRCVRSGVCSEPIESESWADPERGGEPVVGVNWRQARAFAAWAGRRLPSEAEWQRAATDPESGGRFPWGKGRSRVAANVYETSEADPFVGLAPVASFPPTGWGLFDMGGNVWEWCADRYHRGLSGAPGDGQPWIRGGWGRVQRGGSWRRTVDLARVASRSWQDEDYFADDVGFRCVTDPRVRVDPQQLIAMAGQAFPLTGPAGSELAQSDLTRADREFLELRALTWLVLEGRLEEAVPRAVSFLRRDGRNAIALELLEQLEREMETSIQRGDVVTVQAAISGYRSAVEGDRALKSRLMEHESRLKKRTLESGRAFAVRGEYDVAHLSLELAVSLRPEGDSLHELLQEIEPKPGTRRVSARDGKVMAWVPAGDFRMGGSLDDGAANYDEHPARSVAVDGFWMDTTEVTNAEYLRCVDAGACSPPHRRLEFDDPDNSDHPVVWVTWFQAANYSRWARKRLPSEAEWERAARGDTEDRYPWGHQFQPWKVNGVGSEGGDPFPGLAPVASYPPGAWGVYDLLGNAAEWVADVYHRNYWGAPPDSRPWNQVTGEWVEPKRVVRGGSFSGTPNTLRVSNRGSRAPHTSSRNVGFRCVAD